MKKIIIALMAAMMLGSMIVKAESPNSSVDLKSLAVQLNDDVDRISQIQIAIQEARLKRNVALTAATISGLIAGYYTLKVGIKGSFKIDAPEIYHSRQADIIKASAAAAATAGAAGVAYLSNAEIDAHLEDMEATKKALKASIDSLLLMAAEEE